MPARPCRYMVNTDVSITLLMAERLGVPHPVLAWFWRHGDEACYSELLRDGSGTWRGVECSAPGTRRG